MFIRSAFLLTRHYSSTPPVKSFLRYVEAEKMALNTSAATADLPAQRLYEKDGPLVWIDCEMTGLNPIKDKLLEVAVIVTNGDLEQVDDGINLIIRREKDILDNMNPWCINQHGSTGLTQACLKSTHTVEAVASRVLSYIQKWIPEKHIAHLAGNSVHVDRIFLSQEMPEVVNWLHYRIVDVSTIKVLTQRWRPENTWTPKANNHRALDDILGSIQELQHYRQNIFLNSIVQTDETDKGTEPVDRRIPKRRHK